MAHHKTASKFCLQTQQYCSDHNQFTILDINYKEMIFQTILGKMKKTPQLYLLESFMIALAQRSKRQTRPLPLLTQVHQCRTPFLTTLGWIYPLPCANAWEHRLYCPQESSNWYSHLNCKPWISSHWPLHAGLTGIVKLRSTVCSVQKQDLFEFSSHCFSLLFGFCPFLTGNMQI